MAQPDRLTPDETRASHDPTPAGTPGEDRKPWAIRLDVGVSLLGVGARFVLARPTAWQGLCWARVINRVNLAHGRLGSE